MNITDIRIRDVKLQNNVKACVSVTFDDCFVVHNIKVVEGSRGLFVGMPSRKLSSGEYKNVAHPICSEFREKLSASVLEAYKKAEGLADEEA